ncbi:MAG: hypothetical protein CMP11_00045 [Zetaproteobacteria bacterium]|nr:hypothetical protein [Pseudobdellovibrionaceae bacterium]
MRKDRVPFYVAVLLNMNIMIGAGIYLSPPEMAKVAYGWSYLGWGVAALIFLPVVLAVMKLSLLFPKQSGLYAYAQTLLGPTLGFLCGWSYFLAFTSAEALQAVVLRDTFLGCFACELVGPFAYFLVNFSIFSFIAFICLQSLKTIGHIQTGASVLKFFPIIFIISLLILIPFVDFGQLSEEGVSSVLQKSDPGFMTSLISIVPLAMFGYWGFESCCNMAHRIEGGAKKSSLAVLVGFFLVSAIYTLFHFQILNIMGPQNLATEKVEGVTNFLGLSNSYFFQFGTYVFVVSLAFSYFNAILSEVVSFSFLLQTMAKDKALLFSEFLKKNNKNKQPVYAVLFNCFVAFIFMSFIENKSVLICFSNIGSLTAVSICLFALLKFSYVEKKIGTFILTLLAMGSSVVIAYYSILGIDSFYDILSYIILVGLGLVSFLYVKSKAKSLSV